MFKETVRPFAVEQAVNANTLIPVVSALVPRVEYAIRLQEAQGKLIADLIKTNEKTEERHLEMLGAVYRAEGAATLAAREAHAARTGEHRASITNEIQKVTDDLTMARRQALARLWRKAPVWADRLYKAALGALVAYWAIKH